MRKVHEYEHLKEVLARRGSEPGSVSATRVPVLNVQRNGSTLTVSVFAFASDAETAILDQLTVMLREGQYDLLDKVLERLKADAIAEAENARATAARTLSRLGAT